MKYFLRILTVVAALSLSTIAMAQPPLYQVELIVFSHINAQGLNSESWPVLTNPQINFSRAVTLKPLLDNSDTSTPLPTAYTILPNFNFTLSKVGNKLTQAGGYNVIMHIAWHQPINAPYSARWIHVFGGAGYSEDGKAIVQDVDGGASYGQAQHWQVDGLLRLDSVRYIDSSYNLIFAAPAGQIQELSNTNNFSKIDTPLVYFKLNQSRRMRSDELNYISHPLYGVLINITKVKTPEGGKAAA